MKEGNLLLLAGIVLIILGIGVGIYIDEFDKDPVIKKGNCYDNYNNKINGVTCDVESVSPIANSFIMIVILLHMMGFLLMMMGSISKWGKEE